MRASTVRRFVYSNLMHVRRSVVLPYQSAWSIQKRINKEWGQYRVYIVAWHTPGSHPTISGLGERGCDTESYGEFRDTPPV